MRQRVLGELARLAYDTVRKMMTAAVDEPEAGPGMVAVIQTFGSSFDGGWIPVAYVDDRCSAVFDRWFLLEEGFEKTKSEIAVLVRTVTLPCTA